MSQNKPKLSAIQKQLEYWRSYGMANNPFPEVIDDGNYFWNEARENLLQHALQLACCAAKIVVFHGPEGIGKSEFLHALRAQLEDDNQLVVVTVHAGHALSTEQLFADIGRTVGLPARQFESPEDILTQIENKLSVDDAAQRALVILVDDAERLPQNTLAALLELHQSHSRHVNLLMFSATNKFGELREELTGDALERHALEPFTAAEVEAYINDRLAIAGADRIEPFTQEKLDDLVLESGGIPRHINQLATHHLRNMPLRAIEHKPTAEKQTDWIKGVPPWRTFAAAAGFMSVVGFAWYLGSTTGQNVDQAGTRTAQAEEVESKEILADFTPPAISKLKQPPIAKREASGVISGKAAAQAANLEPFKPKLAPRRSEIDETASDKVAARVDVDKVLANAPAAGSVPTTKRAKSEPTAAEQPENVATIDSKAAGPMQHASLKPLKIKNFSPKPQAPLSEDERQLLQSPGNSYTLQLLASSSKDGINQFLKENRKIDILVFEHELEGRPWFVAVTGNFTTVEAARSRLAELPEDLRNLRPWPRQLGSVHGDINR